MAARKSRKKTDPVSAITNLGDSDKLTVQKSIPLFALWKSELTLAEFKILDIYLSRINSHNPDTRVVIFGKGEMEHVLGVQKINHQALEQRLMHLMGNVVKIPDPDESKGFRLVTLFEEAAAEQDEYGLWQIRLECTQKAMKYFFNIENIRYLRYKLRCITSLNSRYAYIMFCYLEQNRFRGSWDVELSKLKIILGADKVETYSAFKEFNKQILKRTQLELLEKTECRYTYEPLKKGRTVVKIRFTLETCSDFMNDDFSTVSTKMIVDQNDLLDLYDDTSVQTQREEELCREKICSGFSDAIFKNFSHDQLEYLKNLAWDRKNDDDVSRHLLAVGDKALACQYATSDYLKKMINRAKVYSPRNLYQYVLKMIEEDL